MTRYISTSIPVTSTHTRVQTPAIRHVRKESHNRPTCNSPAKPTLLYFTDPEQAAHRNNDRMHMAYFTLNQREHNAHQYLYQDIPEHYTFNKSTKQWQQRKPKALKGVIARIYNILPSDAERFALTLILRHRKEATSFKDIQSLDAVTHDTFKNAARAMSLLEDRRRLPHKMQ
eukprot:gene14509-biopygen11613